MGRPDDWLSVREAGDRFPCLGQRFIRRLVEQRRIPSFKVGGKVIVAVPDLEAVIEDGRRPSRSELAGRPGERQRQLRPSVLHDPQLRPSITRPRRSDDR